MLRQIITILSVGNSSDLGWTHKMTDNHPLLDFSADNQMSFFAMERHCPYTNYILQKGHPNIYAAEPHSCL